MQSPGYDINELAQEAQNRWLKPAEVLFILQNHENQQLTETPPKNPPIRFFRKDGHNWRKKRDGRTVGEAHERLKVGNVEALNCYYAHGEQNPNFQRRSYWMLDPEYEHIVLVHYREIREGRHSAGSTTHWSPGSTPTLSHSPSICAAQNPGSISAVSEFYEPYQSSFSPGSVEVNSELVIKNNGMDHLNKKNGSGSFSSSPDTEVSQALRRLEEQLSLNDDDVAEISPLYRQNEQSKDSGVIYCEGRSNQDELASLQSREKDPQFSGNVGLLDVSNSRPFLQNSGDNKKQHHQQFCPESTIERKESPFWKEVLEGCSGSTLIGSQDNSFNSLDRSENSLSSEMGSVSATLAEQPESWTSQWVDFSGNNAENKSNYYPTAENNLSLQLSAAREFLLGPDNSIVSPTSTSLLQEVENSGISVYSSGTSTREANPDYYTMWFDQESHLRNPLESDSKLTLAQKQRFSIREISPDWGYASEDTKVIIAGSFLCNPSECAWACMFGDIEVPVQIIQEGVLRCQAPPNIAGKVTLCITSGNRESCSEVREFEYLNKPRSFENYNLPQSDATKSTEELQLLVRCSQMLLSDTLLRKDNSVASEIDVLTKSKIDEDPWGHIIESLLVGSETQSSTMDWLLQELLKDKLQQWLSSKNGDGDSPSCSLSKKEQGIIHMVAGLGFEWALNPILNSGISINFRDANGWTALHWAARFGREKMVAALIAGGASALAVTDPTSQDPAGKTPGFIAAASGHKGLAGYLSEVALTSHLLSLTLEESEISKGSAAVEAERTVESISKGSLGSTEDQLSLKDSLAAVRNAAQAAARIQSAFRAHSFRRRQHKEAVIPSWDEYGITQDDIHGLSAASKLAFRNLRDYKLNKAAVSIQKKYRGWKGRKDFLALRQKVVRIQAHVRGHQVRKKYKVILWAVGILDKVVLRWRRKGVGLRGFRPESESIDLDEDEDDDILKVFRKQKVDVAIEDAVSQVLSMVESPAARQQYSRMLESHQQAKVESSGSTSETVSISQGSADNMLNDIDELYQFAYE